MAMVLRVNQEQQQLGRLCPVFMPEILHISYASELLVVFRGSQSGMMQSGPMRTAAA